MKEGENVSSGEHERDVLEEIDSEIDALPISPGAQQVLRGIGRAFGIAMAAMTYVGIAGSWTGFGGAPAVVGIGGKMLGHAFLGAARKGVGALPGVFKGISGRAIGRETSMIVIAGLTAVDEGIREGDNFMWGVNNAVGDVLVGGAVGAIGDAREGASENKGFLKTGLSIVAGLGRNTWLGVQSLVPLRILFKEENPVKGWELHNGFDGGWRTPSIEKGEMRHFYSGVSRLALKVGTKSERALGVGGAVAKGAGRGFGGNALGRAISGNRNSGGRKGPLRRVLGMLAGWSMKMVAGRAKGEKTMQNPAGMAQEAPRKPSMDQGARDAKYRRIDEMWRQVEKGGLERLAEMRRLEQPRKPVKVHGDEGLGL